jgi:hypothetical protein
MSEIRFLDYPSLIKHQLASQEVLFEYHSKIEAMLEMILTNDRTDFPKEKLYYYLWAINDVVSRAKDLNTELLNILSSVAL